MPINVPNEKSNIKRIKKKCNDCKKSVLCVTFACGTIQCVKCYKKISTDDIWTLYCDACGNLTVDDDIKECSGCKKAIGRCCGALYHCQSTECTCIDCYDYKCAICDTKFGNKVDLLGKKYISDAGIDSVWYPMCGQCREQYPIATDYDA
jgi:hypothetical protein